MHWIAFNANRVIAMMQELSKGAFSSLWIGVIPAIFCGWNRAIGGIMIVCGSILN